MMNLVDRFAALLIYSLLYLIGSLPESLLVRLSNGIGDLWFAIDKRHRKVALDNLSLAYGKDKNPEEIWGMARDNFRQLSRLLFEVGWSLHLKNARDIGRYIRLDGMEHVIRAFRQGKGVLFLTGHLGSWELLTLVPALIPYTVHDIYRPLDFQPLEKVIVSFRTRFGMKLIAKQGAIRPIFRALSRGEGVGIPLDQSVSKRNGVFVDFFGRLTSTSKGLGLIALKTGAPVLPVFLVREGWRYKVIFGPRITCMLTGDTETDLKRLTQTFNRVLEKAVRKYPSQWFWVHERWKKKAPKTIQSRSSSFK